MPKKIMYYLKKNKYTQKMMNMKMNILKKKELMSRSQKLEENKFYRKTMIIMIKKN